MGATRTLSTGEAKRLGRTGGLTTAALYGGKAMTKPARTGRRAAYERQVEEAHPGLRESDPAEFLNLVERAKKLHLSKAGVKSGQVRSKQREVTPGVSECPQCVEARGDRPVAGREQKLCGRHAKAAKTKEARELNKPASPEAVTLRARMDALEAEFATVRALVETWIRHIFVADADRLTDAIMGDFTKNMRPTPDPSDLAA